MNYIIKNLENKNSKIVCTYVSFLRLIIRNTIKQKNNIIIPIVYNIIYYTVETCLFSLSDKVIGRLVSLQAMMLALIHKVHYRRAAFAIILFHIVVV